MKNLRRFVFAVLSLAFASSYGLAVSVTGRISDSATLSSIAQARVTLFTPDLQYFREARTDSSGNFQFSDIASGTHQLGVAARGYEYQERSVALSIPSVSENFFLSSEVNGGRWTIIGNTDPELLDGSGSGNLLASGEMFFCHDTIDPIMFDPVSRRKWYPPSSGTPQGCHIVTLNTDGGMFLTGGSMGGNPQDPVVKIAKTYWRSTNRWTRQADMFVGRWYPGLVRLPDERLLILGGELNGPEGRTNSCEIYSPTTNAWSPTGSFDLPTEIPPALLLFTGEVLKTWRYPELYNISSGAWRAAAPMIQARRGQATGDHADHEMVHLPDGRVMALGILPAVLNSNTRFCEFYDPGTNTWSLGPNPRAIRGQPEALILPDGRVLSCGGQYSGPTPAPVPLAPAGFVPNCTKVADLYDPATNAWRAMTDMNRFIHYHNVTLLVPDGRVVATGGAGLTTNRSFAGDDSSIEAYEPPYLFRGVRPRIDSVSTTDLTLGGNFTARVSLTNAVTKLVLVSARTATHWVDGGPQRYLTLDASQNGPDLVVAIPNDPVRFLPGWYMLFAMVDDIPSLGRMVRVIPNSLLLPTSATSRRTHGSAGVFDIALPLTGAPGIECRSGGGNNDYQVVVTFPRVVTFNDASVTFGAGSVSGTSGNGSSAVVVNLSGVASGQTIGLTLAGVNDGTRMSNIVIPMGVLVGDTTGDGSVNASDIGQVKTQSGQPVTASNFRSDVTANGSTINSSDIGLMKSQSGTQLP